MRLLELSDTDPQNLKLLALSRFLIGRIKDTDAKKDFSLSAFVDLVQNLGISVTPDSLKTLIRTAPLNSVIANIKDGRVIFKGSVSQDNNTMSVDQARNTVDMMAKRALP
jgi:hypothetical protein